MQRYHATIELATRATRASLAEMVDTYADYHAAGAVSDLGHAQVTLSLPGESLEQATRTALALVKAAGHTPTRIEVLAREEFNRRRGLPALPELISVSEAAELLGVSRQAVQQRIDAGTLPATKVGSTYAIAKAAVSPTDRARLTGQRGRRSD